MKYTTTKQQAVYFPNTLRQMFFNLDKLDDQFNVLLFICVHKLKKNFCGYHYTLFH